MLWLVDYSQRLMAHVADASVRSLCLALAALVLMWASRVRSASVRHAVWTAALCGMLLLPLLSPCLPFIPLRILPAAPAGTPVVQPSVILPGPPAAFADRPAPAPKRQAGLPYWPLAACGVYLAVGLGFLGRLALGFAGTRRLVRRARLVEDARAASCLERQGWRVPSLRESDSVAVPLTTGWLRPQILLPRDWRSWDEVKLRAVLAHELSHVRRGDWLIAVLASLNKCLFWFHPLAWWLERQLLSLAEQASDDSSILATGDRQQYAQVLLDVATALEGKRGRLVWEGAAMARSRQVSRRIDSILDLGRTVSSGLTKRGWAMLALCGVPLLYGAAAVQLERTPAVVQAPTTDFELLAEGQRLTPQEAENIEAHLKTFPEDLTARARLIGYYSAFVNAARQRRLDHVFWLIEHHPESSLLSSPSAAIWRWNDQADYERAKALWPVQTSRYGRDTRVLGNAAHFFAFTDPVTAEDLLRRARQLEPNNTFWAERLAILYARSFWLGGFPDQAAFASRARTELEISSDAALVGAAGQILSGGAPAPMRESVLELAERLLKKAQTLEPANPRWAESLKRLAQAREGKPTAPQVRAEALAPDRIRVGGNLQASKLVTQVPPVYPPLAKQARIQGVVRFQVTSGQDGRVLDVQVVSGHPLLIPAAQEAVKQWVYRPTLLNGRAVEVVTIVDVNFTLSPEAGRAEAQPLAAEPPAAASSAPSGAPQRVRVGGNIQAAKLVRHVRPAYPPLARQARIQGMVRFTVIIGTDGRVENMQLVSGHPLLVPAAQEAVKQWVYQPTFLNGREVEVLTQVDVAFSLSEGNPGTQ
jgi:TonB family protein